MKLALCDQMRELDRTAIECYGVPGIVLMENAALSIFEIIKRLDAYKHKSVGIFCGTGNNGGDGFALARHMHNDGVNVTILLCGEPDKLKGDAKINYDVCVNMKIEISVFDAHGVIYAMSASRRPLVVDAMLGTGASGELKKPIKDAVEIINQSSAYIVAVDCPTGGNPDDGRVGEGRYGGCVKADLTISLALPKPGLFLYPLADYVGKLEIGNIGAPQAVFDKAKTGLYALDAQSAAALLPVRRERSHKGSYGKVAIVAGSFGMAGAAAYCAKAAYKAGCGYVTVYAPCSIIPTVQQLVPQAVAVPMPEKNGALYMCPDDILEKINSSTVCLIGPGLGTNADTAELVKYIIRNVKIPLIIDADAINAISGCMGGSEILLSANMTPIITPHPLEMSRLTGLDTKQILNNMLETAKSFADKYRSVVILKDSVSIIAGFGEVYINNVACSALAKAGSGDILAGITAGFAAQGLESVKAAALAAYVLSESGKSAAAKYGNYSVCSDDLLEHICIDSKA